MHLPAASKALASQIFGGGSSRMKTGNKGRQRTHLEPLQSLGNTNLSLANPGLHGPNGGNGLSGQWNESHNCPSQQMPVHTKST